MEFHQQFRVFQIVSYQLNYIYKGPQTHKVVCLDHLVPFKISLKTFEKFRGMFRGRFRGRFRVFQIVSFKVKHCSDASQIDTE